MHLLPEDNNWKEGTKRTLNSSKQLLWGIPGPAWVYLRADSWHQVPCLDEKMERCPQVLIQVVTGRCYIELTDKGLRKLGHQSLKSCVYLRVLHLFLTFLGPCWDTQIWYPLPSPQPFLSPLCSHSPTFLPQLGHSDRKQCNDYLRMSPVYTKVSQHLGWELGLQDANTIR